MPLYIYLLQNNFDDLKELPLVGIIEFLLRNRQVNGTQN